MSKDVSETQRSYWEGRYLAEGSIWGYEPSKTAPMALERFTQHGVGSVLVTGSGCGRNTKVFTDAGLHVVGIEISEAAVELARRHDPLTDSRLGSALEMGAGTEVHDAVYGFNIMHLFRREQRLEFLRQCADRLRAGGLIFMVVFSDEEASYGHGTEVEPGTFENKGRPVHYFTDRELREELAGFAILETGSVEDREEHGAGPHSHALRYALGRKLR